jgi:hypothetical protein
VLRLPLVMRNGNEFALRVHTHGESQNRRIRILTKGR